VLVATILLYNCENWCLTRVLERKLEVFFNRCVRTMCKTNLYKTWKNKISTVDLLARMKMVDLKSFMGSRSLNWLGKIGRMDFDKCQIRRLLTSWIDEKRNRGGQKLNFGRSTVRRYFEAVISRGPI